MKAALAVLMLALSPLAFAHNCPNVMKEIDAKLSSASGLSAETMERVRQLRAEGERLHKAGDHDESMRQLEQAKALLGA